MYKRCRTFEDLCDYGAAYVKDLVKEHPFWGINSDDKKNLYELTNDKQWIANTIYKYNKLGFFTNCSQPGDIANTLFMNHIGMP